MKTRHIAPLAFFAAALSMAACNPCAAPTVPASYVTVATEQGGAIAGLVVTAQRGDTTVTFNCGGSGDVPADAAANSDASGAFAPVQGTRCTFNGGLGEGPITVRASAPGYMPAERVVPASELTMPTGCGFALNLSLVLRAQ